MFEATKRVSVAVRVRPILRSGGSHTHQQEKFELEATSRISDTQIKVEQKKQDEACRSSVFSFDYIFDQESTQLEVYEEAVVELVDATLTGANATILAYGQTGSGKTHTVLGEVKPNPLENDLLTHNSGLFLRVLSDLMEYKRRRSGDLHVVVGLSCVEIYNENIRDLFGGSPNEPPPALRAVMLGDDVVLPSLIVKEVTSLQAVFTEIQLAISRRQSRSTEMNAASSRSHCLFMIDILQCPVTAPVPSLSILDTHKNPTGATTDAKAGRARGQTVVESSKGDAQGGRQRGQTVVGNSAPSSSQSQQTNPDIPFIGTIYRIPGQTEPVWGSKIMLADLAGSEKIKNSGVSGEGLAEATSINSSLTALGNVVHSLHEGSYVSYRTSNLTRLFKPTFSHPASRVLLLAQVSPTQLTFDETINTLHFANKVKAMKVTTVTGAEAEKLQFDVIEAEKVYDALIADLHIFRTETGCNTIIHRHLARTSRNPVLFYDARAKKAYKRDERRALLEQAGLLQLAEAEKVAAQRRKAEEDEARARHQIESFHKHRDETVNAHKEQRSDTCEGLQQIENERNQHALQLLQLDQSAQRSILEVEESLAWLALEKQSFDERITIGHSEIKAMDATIEQLRTLGVETSPHAMSTAMGARQRHLDPTPTASPSSATSTDHITDTEQMEADRQYALACYAHCASKRFFMSIMGLRESQLLCNLAKTQTIALQTFVNKLGAASSEPSSASTKQR